MPRDTHGVPRKQVRFGHVSERGGVNAVRTLLEAHGHVVDEVDGRNDYGRDLIVDVAERGEITGAVIGLQVKGDRRFITSDVWKLPVGAKDRQYWAESGIPIVGILRNPVNGEMRWTNLTEYARYEAATTTWQPSWLRHHYDEPYDPSFVYFPEYQVLNDTTLPGMIGLMQGFARQNASLSFLSLFDSGAERSLSGVFACWAVGHTDHRALLLLRSALTSLSGKALAEAIRILSSAADSGNCWWSEEIKRYLQAELRWSPQEIYNLASKVDVPCTLLSLLAYDPNFPSYMPASLELAIAQHDLNGAFQLWMLFRHLSDDQIETVDVTLARYPELCAHPSVQDEIDQITVADDDPWRNLIEDLGSPPYCHYCQSILKLPL